jgi:16S rRNA (guanine527-N7)-methyltransferase
MHKLLASLGIATTVEPVLSAFIPLFEKWNKQINLSAARSRDDILEHIRDSLHVVPYLVGRTSILDVGSGGGFPAVVAAACLPTSEFVALEPVHKKHAFLRTAARELGLSNLSAFAERIEDHSRRDYDAATSRATMDLRDWLLLGSDYVIPGGIVLGFEAQQRSDLPPTTSRHSYALDEKQRAIVLLQR